MELALFTDSVSELSFEQALDLAVELEIGAIEIATGGQSPAPHLKLDELLTDPGSVAAFRAAFEERGLRIAALNCSAWPLHPVHDEAHRRLIRRTIELAERLDVRTIVTMSGCGGEPGGTWANWVWYPWPDEAVSLSERQWTDAIRLWKELAEYARERGVERIALELHPLHLAYNVPTLLRLREAVGPIVGANVDPSHFFWQQMDAEAILDAIGERVGHVHAKDVVFNERVLARQGLLHHRWPGSSDQTPWKFATVGLGHDASWWTRFVERLPAAVRAVAIEHEDPDVSPADGVPAAARILAAALSAPVVEVAG
jgi:sugar phosphate isomerase/epimerase